MLNKKLLAVSVAALFTSAANAAVNLTADPIVPLKYESAAVSGIAADGFFVANDTGGTDLDIEFAAGVGIPNAGVRFIRVDLTNARFTTLSAIAGDGAGGDDSIQGTNIQATLLEGGGDESTFAIFQINAAAVIASTAKFTLKSVDYDIAEAGNASVQFAQYTDFAQASNSSNALQSSISSGTFALVESDVAGVVSTDNDLVATVNNSFTTFTAATEDNVGSMVVSTANYFADNDTLDPSDSTAVTFDDVLETTQKITFKGDFSFAEWSIDPQADCDGTKVASTLNSDEDELVTNADIAIATEHFLCIDNATDPETILRGSYSVTLEKDGVDGDLGSITYDTTAITIPYLTTFTDYNQRVYIINSSSKDAAYSTTFRTEVGTTATDGSAATGVVPANSVLAIKASDMVSLDGRTRTSAIIEIEADDTDIKATTQTINLSDKSTDTVDLLVE